MENLKKDLKTNKQLILDLQVITNSSCLKLKKLGLSKYKLKLTNLPEKEKANQEILKFFKDNLKPLKIELDILKGSLKTNKKIKINLIK
jgi:uncharacterized protein YggU (UPF0235/DUF167 family)